MMKQVNPEEYFRKINIPEDWDNLEAFVAWFYEVRMPLAIPANARVFVTDNATSICLFKRGRYQIELYLIHPGTGVDSHSHPGIQTILSPLGTGRGMQPTRYPGVSFSWGTISDSVIDLEPHGGGMPDEVPPQENGFGLLAFERWDESVPMTSAAVRWVGETAGPLQEALIREFYPDAYVVPGFADVTKTKEDK